MLYHFTTPTFYVCQLDAIFTLPWYIAINKSLPFYSWIRYAVSNTKFYTLLLTALGKEQALAEGGSPFEDVATGGVPCYNRWTHTLNKWVTIAVVYLVGYRQKVDTCNWTDNVLEGHERNLRNWDGVELIIFHFIYIYMGLGFSI